MLPLLHRTDAHVHALHSTLHVDLERKNGEPYETKYMTANLNKYMEKSNLDINVQSVEHVPRKFSARRAVSRTYLYRLAIRRIPNANHQFPVHYESIPIEELNRCYFRVS